jgi:uncharacterized membrane protein
MPPAARATLAQLLIVAGLALSTYLAALKYLGLPCLGSSGCQTVMNSPYGEFLRIPVGAFGALLWLAIIYIPDRSKRGVLLLLMAATTAVYMMIQFFILRGFCLYCTLHAVVAWGVLWLHGETPRRWTAPLGLVLATGALLLTRQQVETRVAATTAHLPPSASANLHASGAGLYWLGPFTEKSPALVLSLDCPACLDLLEALTQRTYAGTAAGPSLYFKTNNANRTLTETFVAAVLSQDGTPRDAFLAVATLLLTHKDTALNAPASAAQQLAALFPAAAPRRVAAVRILDDQATALQAAALGETTPLLLPREGKPRAFFKIEDLFPR